MENNELRENIRKKVKEKIAVSNIRKEFDMKEKNRRKLIYGITSSAAVVILGIGVIIGTGNFKNLTNNNNNEIADLQENKEEILEEKLNINKLDEMAMLRYDADFQIIEENASVKNGRFEVVKELEDFPFYKDIDIPNEYNAFTIYAIYVRSSKDNVEYNKLNSYVISYKVKDKEKDFKDIRISFSKENVPIRDYYFINGNDKKSIINGFELQIYQYETSYMTKFKYNDINFDIETHNVSEIELINLLKSIIK